MKMVEVYRDSIYLEWVQKNCGSLLEQPKNITPLYGENWHYHDLGGKRIFVFYRNEDATAFKLRFGV